jgi:hypothetical protein
VRVSGPDGLDARGQDQITRAASAPGGSGRLARRMSSIMPLLRSAPAALLYPHAIISSP